MAKKLSPTATPKPAADPSVAMASTAPEGREPAAVKPTAGATATGTAKPKSTKPQATNVPPAVSASPATEVTLANSQAVTDQMIADRAYYKWQNGEAGDHQSHWHAAERELRGNG